MTEVISIVGMRGSGKSTLTKRLAQKHSRIIVFDKMNEWVKYASHICNDLESFKIFWRENFHKKSFLCVIQFPFGSEIDDLQELTDTIVKILYHTGLESEQDTCLIFEEAQFYFPSMQVSGVMFELLTTGRHASLSIIANTQRPASVSKLLISQSDKVFVGQIFEFNDLKYLVGSLGESAKHVRQLQKFYFLKYEIGKELPDTIRNDAKHL